MMRDIEIEPNSGSDNDSICAELTFAQCLSNHSSEYHSSIIIDSISYCSVICDDSLLTNICVSDQYLQVFTNGGPQVSNKCCDSFQFFEVLYKPNLILKILSWSQVSENFRIAFDSATDDCMKVHIANDI